MARPPISHSASTGFHIREIDSPGKVFVNVKTTTLPLPMKHSFLKHIVVLALFATSATAGTHTWTGASSGLWSASGNWTGGAPVSGEAAPVILIFPTGASH